MPQGGDEEERARNELAGWLERSTRAKFQALNLSRLEGARIDPDRAARVVSLSLREKLPHELVDANLEEVEAQAKLRTGPPEEWWRRHPITERFIRTNPYYASLASNEIAKLGHLVDELLSLPKWAWPIPDKEIERIASATAEREAPKAVRAYQNLLPAVLDKEGRPGAPAPVDVNAIKDAIRRKEVERLKAENAFISSKDPISFTEQLFGTAGPSLADRLPFIGDFTRMGRAVELYQAALAIEEGRASENDIELLRRFWRLENAAARRGTTFAAEVAEIGASLLKSMPEFALTSGLYGVGKEGAKRLLVKAAEKAAEGKVKTLAIGAATRAAGVAVQTTALSAAKTLAGTIERMTPRFTFTPELEAVMNRPEDDFMSALLRSYGIETVEVGTERLGKLVSDLSGPLKRFVASRWLLKHGAGAESQSALARAIEAAGWNGIVGEILEERAAGFGEKIIEGKPLLDALQAETPKLLGGDLPSRRLIAEAIAFSVPGLAVKLSERAATTALSPKERQNPEILKAIGDSIRSLKLSQKAPEAVEELAKAATQNTAHAFLYAPVEDWEKYWSSKGVDALSKAEELGVERHAYKRAKATGGSVAISTASYVARIGPSEEDNAALASIMRQHPQEMTEEEIKEFLQTEEEKRAAEEKIIEALMTSEAVEERAKILARQMAVEDLRILRETDIIAQIERATPGRIYWSDPTGKRNVKELTTASIPKHLIANPKTAKEKGPSYAVAINEVADLFGMKSDELIHAIEEAFERRRKAEEKTRDPRIPETLLRDVAIQVMEEEVARTLSSQKEEEEKKKLPATPKKERPSGPPPTSSERVRRLVLEQLRAAGFPSKQAEPQAKIVEALFRTLAVRLSRDPFELYDRYGLRIIRQLSLKKEAIEGVEKVLTQASPKEPREPKGRTTVRGRKIEIELFRKADLSTFIHELGHFFLEVMGDLAVEESAPEDLKKDWQAVLSFLGVESRDAITTNHHEKFAKAFEAYLFEGKAPSLTLRSIFARFKAWLLHVYRTLSGIGVALSDDIRRVFDRLLATQEELEEAYAVLGQKALDVQALGMSVEEGKHYASLIEEAKREAEELLHSEVAKEMSILWEKEFERIRKEVEEELHRDPRYIAFHVLRYGRMPNGAPVPGDKKNWKLSSQVIVSSFGGQERLKGLRGTYVAEEGAHPNEMAEILRLSFGLPFKNGEELLSAIENLEPLEAAIKRVAHARTLEQVGPQPGTAEMAERVQKAIHNDKGGELLLLELRHIAARGSRKVAPLEVIRHWAEGEVEERMKIGELLHGAIANWRRAAAKANKAAFEAVAKKNWDEAFIQKERELLNLELLRAAERAQEEIEDGFAYVSTFNKKSKREAIARARGDYLEQIDALLERFEFRRISAKTISRRLSFRAWVEKQQEEGTPLDVPEELLNDAYRKSWFEMSFEEFTGIIDTLRHLDHLARFKGKLLQAREKAELEELTSRAAKSLIDAQGGKPPRKVLEHRSPEEERKRVFAAFLASHVRIPTFAREFDGFKDGGIWWETIIRTANEASTEESRLATEAILKFEEIRSKYYQPGEWAKFRRERRYFPSIDAALTKEAVLAIALNWGNEDNQTKLKRGRNWSEDKVKEILDSLEERDWKFVQEIWDWIDSFWPAIERVSKNLKGIAPKKVKALPVVTRFGTLRGGYYPLKYEPHESERVSIIEAKQEAQEFFRASALSAQTRHGHRKERVKGVNLPVRLDLGVLFEHVRQVIHDVTHAEVIYDINRFIRHENIERAIKAYYGTPVYTEFKNWVRDIARGPQHTLHAVERALLWLRTGTIISRLGFNLKSALLQVTGLSTSVRRLGLGRVVRALHKFLGTPEEIQKTLDGIRSISPLMRARTQNQIREVSELREKAFQEGKLSKIQDSWLFLTSRTQFLVDAVTWLAAHEYAVEKVAREKMPSEEERQAKAIAIADQIVLDTQGSGEIKDLASVQRANPLLKLFTTFYGYFSIIFNETRLAFKEFGVSPRGPADVGKLAVDLLLLYSFPAAFAAALATLARGDDDNETFLKNLAKEHTSTVLNTMVLARELTGVVEAFQYRGPAGSSVIGDVANLAIQIGQGEVDEAALRAGVITTGGLFHYPALQLWRTVKGIKDVLSGEPRGALTVLIGR